jgi:hypothetical protein
MLQRALLDVLGTVSVPLLDRVVVEELRDEKGAFEVGLGMRVPR